MAGETNGGKPGIKTKVIVASILGVVAIALVVGTYLWQKGKIFTGANVPSPAADSFESISSVSEEDEEAAVVTRGIWRVPGDVVSYEDGALVRQDGKDEVYLIYRGTKRQIKDVTTFTRLHLKWRNVIVNPASDPNYLGKYETGPMIEGADLHNLPNGLICRFRGINVYQVVNGKLRWYPSPSVFLSHHRWGEIAVFTRYETPPTQYRDEPFDVPDSDLEEAQMTTEPTAFRYRGGSLVRAENDIKVYYTAGNRKFLIPDVETFNNLDFKWAAIRVGERGILDTKDAAGNPMYKDTNLPNKNNSRVLRARVWRWSDSPTVYLTMYYSGERTNLRFTSPEVFLNRFRWNEVGVYNR